MEFFDKMELPYGGEKSMQANNALGSSLSYIEQNLKTTIAANELADMVGYSVWHYYRLFAQVTGLPVAAYICKRRLDCALVEISEGRKAVDVVLEYGFDTYAGFYKAFVKMYGCSPKKYLSIYGKYQEKKSGGFYMLTEHELREVLANWDVPQNLPLTDIWIMDGAAISGNVWSFGDGYVLKAGERIPLLKNIKIQKALAAQGFMAATPVATKAGDEYLDGEQIFTLTHKIPGSPLKKEDRFGESRKNFGFKYGISIAKLHQTLAGLETEIMPNETNLYEQVIEWAMPNVKKQNEQWGLGLSDEFFHDYTETFGLIFSKLPKQIIHRDVHPSNILFDNGEVNGFINFDLSERNVRLWDPCYCSTGLLCEWRGVDNIQEKWPDVLAGVLLGYDSVNHLSPEEKQAVFYVICSIQMICVAYFESVDKFKELAKTNREMLQFIAWKKEYISGIFN